MRETFLLLFLMTVMTAFTLRPMLDPSGTNVAGGDEAPAAATLDARGAELLAAHFPAHTRLRAEAAAGDRAKW